MAAFLAGSPQHCYCVIHWLKPPCNVQKASTLGTKRNHFLFSRFLRREQNKLLCNPTPFSLIYVQTKSTHKSQMAGLKSALKIERAWWMCWATFILSTQLLIALITIPTLITVAFTPTFFIVVDVKKNYLLWLCVSSSKCQIYKNIKIILTPLIMTSTCLYI